MKAKVVDLEDEVREGFSRRISKELNGEVQGVSGNRSVLVRFQDVFEKYVSSNQLTVMTVEKIPVNE